MLIEKLLEIVQSLVLISLRLSIPCFGIFGSEQFSAGNDTKVQDVLSGSESLTTLQKVAFIFSSFGYKNGFS